MDGPALRRLAIRRGYICPTCIARRRPVHPPSKRNFHASPLRHQGVLETLEARGLVNQVAGNRATLSNALATKRLSIYAGIDPTAPSLHLGHLLPLMVLFWLHNHGHNVISLVGGATSRVGDPSGRLTSRAKVDVDEQRRNFEKMWAQTERLWERAEAYGKRYGVEKRGERLLLDNAEWLDRLNVLDFLRMLGNGMRVGTMLGRDTVRNKMEKGDGMSFSEFTYPLLQGWDWWHMYQKHGTQVQVGGSDQYGNIIAGMDAVKFIAQNEGPAASNDDRGLTEPMGLTVPLLTTSSGEKFGKSAGNAIWLDLKMTSSFDLYGCLLRTADADVKRYLKLFTFVPLITLSEIMVKHMQDPGKRKAQHLLAGEVLELVHGAEEAQKAKAEHERMRNPTIGSVVLNPSAAKEQSIKDASNSDIRPAQPEEHSPTEQHIVLAESKVFDLPIATVLSNAGLASSKSEATRMIKGGGVYIAIPNKDGGQLSWEPVRSLSSTDNARDLLIERKLVFRLGKWKVREVEVSGD